MEIGIGRHSDISLCTKDPIRELIKWGLNPLHYIPHTRAPTTTPPLLSLLPLLYPFHRQILETNPASVIGNPSPTPPPQPPPIHTATLHCIMRARLRCHSVIVSTDNIDPICWNNSSTCRQNCMWTMGNMYTTYTDDHIKSILRELEPLPLPPAMWFNLYTYQSRAPPTIHRGRVGIRPFFLITLKPAI